MKKLILPVMLFCAVVISSCSSFKEAKRITDAQRDVVEKEVPKLFPSPTLIHTNQSEDDRSLSIIITDTKFYDASSADKQAAAVKCGAILVHVLGGDNGISKFTLVLTKNPATDNGIPDDGIKMDMKVDSLIKAGVK